MERKYYDSNLAIDGTAPELYTQVRNGYYDNRMDSMEKIKEILEGEGLHHEAMMVKANMEYCSEASKEDPDKELLSYCAFVADIESYKAEHHGEWPGYQITLEEIESNVDGVYTSINAFYDFRQDDIAIGTYQYNGETDTERLGASRFTYDEIKDWTGEDFRKAANEIMFYAEELVKDNDEYSKE